jgi:hypothetical protein
MRPAARLLALGAALGAFLAVPSAHATRVAILIANDRGGAGDQPLRYAESDAGRLGRVLTRLGGFAAEATILVRGRTAGEIRRAFAEARRQLAAQPGQHLAFIYYSGHADGEALHIGDELLALAELKAMTMALPAAARVVVVDACQAGALTRVKGGNLGLTFAAPAEPTPPRGLAILASNSAGELAQESDEIGGAFFTHYLLAALAGAADADRDGRVSLAEAFDFSSQRTFAATIRTAAGPQHPTFRFDLTGERDIVLTRPAAQGTGFGRLVLDRPGWYFLRRGGDHSVTEIVSQGRDELALEPGRYEIAKRLHDRLELADLDLNAGEDPIALSAAPTRSIAYGRVVRKGAVRQSAYGLAFIGGARSDVASVGPAATASLIGRMDARSFSVELRTGIERAVFNGEHVTTTTSNVFATLAALRAVDLRQLTLAGGVEAGWAAFSQERSCASGGGLSHAVVAGPVASAEWPFGPRFCLRADVGVPLFLMRESTAAGEDVRVRVAARAGLGAGVSF